MPDPVTEERVMECIRQVDMRVNPQSDMPGDYVMRTLAAFARQVLAAPYCRECDKACRHRENNA